MKIQTIFKQTWALAVIINFYKLEKRIFCILSECDLGYVILMGLAQR